MCTAAAEMGRAGTAADSEWRRPSTIAEDRTRWSRRRTHRHERGKGTPANQDSAEPGPDPSPAHEIQRLHGTTPVGTAAREMGRVGTEANGVYREGLTNMVVGDKTRWRPVKDSQSSASLRLDTFFFLFPFLTFVLHFCNKYF